MHDIWDSPVLCEFCRADKHPFLEASGNEGRLIFSLSMDGFNPYQSKKAGKVVSTAAIYMICLNLPPAIRYKLENMYLVGIIPGPREPLLDQVNHVLRPLVDDLLQFWHHGVRLSSTPLFSQGRLVRCAVLLRNTKDDQKGDILEDFILGWGILRIRISVGKLL